MFIINIIKDLYNINMKYNLNKNDTSKLHKLFDTYDENIAVADAILYFLNTEDNLFENIDKENIYDEFIFRLNADAEYDQLFKSYFPNGFDILNVDRYKANPYFKKIKSQTIKNNHYELSYEKYLPKELFIYDDLNINSDEFYKEYSKVGYFLKPYHYLTLKQQNQIWMSITPNEINTMEADIEKMNGNIIVFGLGLGYFSYMCSLKESVVSITIIEKDKAIIDIFKKYLLPQFENANKIHIIHDDAYNYLDQIKNYNCAYVDLWHNPNDGLDFYLKFKANEFKHPNTPIYYWLEKGLIALIRRCAIYALIIGYTSEEVELDKNNDADKLTYKIVQSLKNKVFCNYQEIHNYLSENNLKNIINKLQ